VVKLALGLTLCLAACSEASLPPDILLISIDSVRADALTFRDTFASPHMTALAEGGTVFTRAISGSSWTLPAHAQIFTGNPPLLHGTQYDDVSIDPLMATLPELLKAEGYFTAGFWTGWYLAGEYGFSRGFDVYENAMNQGASIEQQYKQALDVNDHDLAKRVFGGRDKLSHQDITSETVIDRIETSLKRAPKDRGLFLFAHFFDPHYDLIPPAPWDTAFDPGYSGNLDGRDFYTNKRIFDADKTPRRQVGDRDLEHLVSLYHGEIAWTDAAIGKLFEVLETRGRLDETLVIITSDHGDEFFEHGGRGHRHSLFDELVHVPMLVRLPKSARKNDPPISVATQVSLSDLLPTILEVVGIEQPSGVYGRSLFAGLQGQRLLARPIISTLTVTGSGPGGKTIDLLLDSVRTEEFKFIRRLKLDPKLEYPLVTEALYFDLKNDPAEQRPILDRSDPRLSKAQELLDQELVKLRAHYDLQAHSKGENRSTNVRELFEADLESLGYSGEDGQTEQTSPGFGMPWGTAPHPPPRDGE
jgi:arylsulfatase A-like enzyme